MDYQTLSTLGARAIESWCRPYPCEVSGEIKSYSFDIKSTEFSLKLFIPPASERQQILDETDDPQVGASNVTGHLVARGDKHSSRSALAQVEQRDIRPGWEHRDPGHGVALIYAPFVHYLRHKLDVPEPIDTQENRLIGLPSHKDDEWVQGAGGARIDIEIMAMTHGKVKCHGQWIQWIYPITEKGQEMSLKIRKWKKE